MYLIKSDPIHSLSWSKKGQPFFLAAVELRIQCKPLSAKLLVIPHVGF